jgi:hypothetical protein
MEEKGFGMRVRHLLMAVLALSAPASAEDLLDRPIMESRVAFLSGVSHVEDLGSLSASFTMLAPLEVEAGYGTTDFGAPPASAAAASSVTKGGYLRAGARIHLLDHRHNWQGMTVDVSGLGGIRGAWAGDVTGTPLGVNGVVAFSSTYWLAEHLGFHAQAVAGGVYWFQDAPSSRTVYPDVRLAIGLAF